MASSPPPNYSRLTPEQAVLKNFLGKPSYIPPKQSNLEDTNTEYIPPTSTYNSKGYTSLNEQPEYRSGGSDASSDTESDKE